VRVSRRHTPAVSFISRASHDSGFFRARRILLKQGFNPTTTKSLPARIIHKAEGHMNIPEKETFGLFDEIGPKDEVLQRSHRKLAPNSLFMKRSHVQVPFNLLLSLRNFCRLAHSKF
jgi:hypothetical protein